MKTRVSAVSLGSGLIMFVLLATASAEPRRGRGKTPEMAETEEGGNREERFLNIFQVVRFPNDACNTTSGNSGVCYTAQECINRGGTQSGSCASGFGTCCSFSIGCGGTTSQNNTYFSSGDQDSSPCTAKVCKCSSDICQLRYDFDTFNIAQPDNTAVAGLGVTLQNGQCLASTFSATSDGTSPPLICGSNTGEHMIVEAVDGCNTVSFTWTSSNPRVWRIKISQISCKDPHKPPEGCTQYYQESSGIIQSYNFLGGHHLADQNQNICIRTEKGQCQLNFYDATVETSGKVAVTADGELNSIGDACKTDYVMVPGGFGPNVDADNDRYCGRLLVANTGITLANGNAADIVTTLKTVKKPFLISFISNSGEIVATDSPSDSGFQFAYSQSMENCINS